MSHVQQGSYTREHYHILHGRSENFKKPDIIEQESISLTFQFTQKIVVQRTDQAMKKILLFWQFSWVTKSKS